MRTRYRGAVVVTAAAACLFAVGAPAQAIPLPPLPPLPFVVLSQGHVDPVDVGFEDGRLKISYHDATVEPDVERNPATVISVVQPQARTQVPDDPAFAFLGAPGADVWVLPEVENPELLFPGIATEELESGVFVNDTVTVRFKAVLGPDGVSLFTTGAGGEPNILVDSEDGLPDNVVQPVGTHAHQNWAFEAPGIYFIIVDATATLAATGQQLTSAPAVLTFVVQR